MTKKKSVEGAQRRDSWAFQGDEIRNLECTDQVRWQAIDDKHVEAFISTIVSGGTWPPVFVTVDSITNKPMLFEGRHRREAALRINADPSKYGLPGPVALEAVAKAYDATQALQLAVRMNTGLPYSVVDQAYIVRRCDNLSMPREMTAKLLGISQAQCAMREKYCDLPEEFKMSLHRGQQAESTAKALIEARKLKDENGELVMDDEVWQIHVASVISGDEKPHELRTLVNSYKRQAGKPVPRGMGELRGALKSTKSIRSRRISGWVQGNPSVTKEMFIEALSDGPIQGCSADKKLESLGTKQDKRQARDSQPKRKRGRPPKSLTPIAPPAANTLVPVDDDDDEGGNVWTRVDDDEDPDVQANGDLLKALGVD